MKEPQKVVSISGDTMVGIMGSKGKLTRQHQKAPLCLQSKIHFHLLLKVFRHLGICLHLKVHHLLPNVCLVKTQYGGMSHAKSLVIIMSQIGVLGGYDHKYVVN
jgi:hypothetical protein